MIWRVRGPGRSEDELVLVVSDVFVEWLRVRAHDVAVRALDPYRDTVLEGAVLERWREDLALVEHDRAGEVAAALAETRRLPRDASTRDAMLKEWVEQALAADEHHRTLRDIAAAVSLALEIGGAIHLWGD